MEKKKRIPFSKIEQDVRHKYRKNLGLAESTEDIKKFFGYAVKELFELAFEGQIELENDDILLAPESAGGFALSAKIKKLPVLKEAWESSELEKILCHFAEQGNHLIQHLEATHPDKTETKINPTASHAGRFHHPPQGKSGPHI